MNSSREVRRHWKEEGLNAYKRGPESFSSSDVFKGINFSYEVKEPSNDGPRDNLYSIIGKALEGRSKSKSHDIFATLKKLVESSSTINVDLIFPGDKITIKETNEGVLFTIEGKRGGKREALIKINADDPGTETAPEKQPVITPEFAELQRKYFYLELVYTRVEDFYKTVLGSEWNPGIDIKASAPKQGDSAERMTAVKEQLTKMESELDKICTTLYQTILEGRLDVIMTTEEYQAWLEEDHNFPETMYEYNRYGLSSKVRFLDLILQEWMRLEAIKGGH